MLRLLVLLLFHSFVSEASNDEFACGTPKHSLAGVAKLRSGGARPGQDTSMIEFPWFVQLQYGGGSDRQCAGSLISDRHVLTARRCVDTEGPNKRSDSVLKAKDISVLYGTRQKYGGMMKVKAVRTYDAKLKKGAAGDLAVFELEKAVEFSDVARPICLASKFDERTQNTVFGLHFGQKKRPEDEELTRPLYFDVLNAADTKNCAESLGRDFHKDEFCVNKRNQVFVEGIHIGAPIMTPNNDGGRWVQVGISLKATKENNYGSATRIDLYDKVIQELTHCYIKGSGVDSRPSGLKDSFYVFHDDYNDDAHDDDDDDIFHDDDDKKTFHNDYNDYAHHDDNDTFQDDDDKKTFHNDYNAYAHHDDNNMFHHDYIREQIFRDDYWMWLLNDDPRNKTDLDGDSYVQCYAVNPMRHEIAVFDCNEENTVGCEVAPEDGACEKDGDVYFNDDKNEGYCYRVLQETVEKDAVAACRRADAGEAAYVHSPQENHLLALMFRQRYEGDSTITCLRLGVFFDESSGQSSLRQVVDGSGFDFGAQPYCAVPKCGSDPGYPWCDGEPNCEGNETSLLLMSKLYRGDTLLGHDCWDDGLASRSCPVVCKKKLH